MSGLNPETSLNQLRLYTNGERPFRLVTDYDTDNVSKKVLRIIMSYTEYINRTVWFKR